jgi:prolyl oligopeptidase PreP (S9A serine peptidase family)
MNPQSRRSWRAALASLRSANRRDLAIIGGGAGGLVVASVTTQLPRSPETRAVQNVSRPSD